MPLTRQQEAAAVPVRTFAQAEPAQPGGPARSRSKRRGRLHLSFSAAPHAARVLLIDPDDSARSILNARLTREGFEVTQAGSAKEAAWHWGPGGLLPSVVVCEAVLGEEDGFDLCAKLRAYPRTAEVPVILMGRAVPGDRARAASAGADEFVAKPTYASDLLALVKLMAGKSSLRDTFSANTNVLPVAHLMRALLSGIRSGRLEFSRGEGALVFRKGKVVDATWGEHRGAEAVMQHFLLARGNYTVSFGSELERGSFAMDLEELCTAAFPRVQRWHQLLERAVPLDACLVADFSRLAKAQPTLPEAVHKLVRPFDGFRVLRDCLPLSGLDLVTALEVVTRLYAQEILVPADRNPRRPGEKRFFRSPELFEPPGADAQSNGHTFRWSDLTRPVPAVRGAAQSARGLGAFQRLPALALPGEAAYEEFDWFRENAARVAREAARIRLQGRRGLQRFLGVVLWAALGAAAGAAGFELLTAFLSR